MIGGAVGVAIQLVPYGWQHSNPRVVSDAPWQDEAVAARARVACYDCHSNETRWPAHSYVAPMSWLVRRDVDAGRDELNFSEWEPDREDGEDAAEAIAAGSMPPRRYLLVHPDAALSPDERRSLITALLAMDEAAGEEDDGEDRSGSNRGPG